MNDTKEDHATQTIQVGSGQAKGFNKKQSLLTAMIIAVLAVAGVIGFAVYQKAQQDKRDREAIVAFENNRYTEARNSINKLLIKNDYNSVIKKADEFIGTSTNKDHIMKMKTVKGSAYMNLKDYPAALAVYKDAQKDADALGDKTNYTIHHSLGILYLQMGEKKLALQEYETVLKGLTRDKKAQNMEITIFEEEVKMLREEVKQ